MEFELKKKGVFEKKKKLVSSAGRGEKVTLVILLHTASLNGTRRPRKRKIQYFKWKQEKEARKNFSPVTSRQIEIKRAGVGKDEEENELFEMILNDVGFF